MLLWHGREPVGLCVFASPASGISLRSRYFGISGITHRTALRALNDQLWLLQRVVLHPTYRGAGVAAAFVRRACQLCPVDWIETLSAMGQINPFFERAGFVRVGTIRKSGRTPFRRSRRHRETERMSRFSEPVYYVFDNRSRAKGSH